jgi:hypothetical protein
LGGYPLVIIHGEETAPAVASVSTTSFVGVEVFAAVLSALRDARLYLTDRRKSGQRTPLRPSVLAPRIFTSPYVIGAVD